MNNFLLRKKILLFLEKNNVYLDQSDFANPKNSQAKNPYGVRSLYVQLLQSPEVLRGKPPVDLFFVVFHAHDIALLDLL